MLNSLLTSSPAAQSYLYQILAGINFCHQRRVLHRDLKPQNLLIDKSGALKLADFGLSTKLTVQAKKRTTEKGTPHWTAPEIIQGQPYDHKIDVWSFGIYAYELAMGKPPFMNETGQEAINCAILDQPIPPIQGSYSADFKSFIDCCLQKDPKKRWSSKDLLNHKFLLNADSFKGEIP